MKRCSWKKILCAGCLGVFTLMSVDAEAGIVTDRVPMLTYADHTVPTYDKPGGKQRGFISPNVSLVMIRQIRPDGWAYGSYPIAGGKRIYRWFQMQELQGYWDFKNYSRTFDCDQVIYRTSALAAKTGKLLGKQKAVVVGAEGDYLKVIYRVNGGSEWKMGWIGEIVEKEPITPPDNPETDSDSDPNPQYPFNININIENNPNIQNKVDVNNTNTNENTNANNNENQNENINENANSNENQNANSNENSNKNANRNESRNHNTNKG